MKNLREMDHQEEEESRSLLLNSGDAAVSPKSSTDKSFHVKEEVSIYGDKKKNPILLQIIKFKNFYQSESLRRVRRWVALVIGALVMIACGTQYSFSSISPSLKK